MLHARFLSCRGRDERRLLFLVFRPFFLGLVPELVLMLIGSPEDLLVYACKMDDQDQAVVL